MCVVFYRLGLIGESSDNAYECDNGEKIKKAKKEAIAKAKEFTK